MKVFNIAPNQTAVTNGDSETFYSYGTEIATRQQNTITVRGSWWDYSNNTRKYFCQWSGFKNKADVLKAIEHGIIKQS